MLNYNKQLKLSQYSGIYDAVIPKNHLLRKIKENVDFSFVNELMKQSYCETFGRPAYEPEIMLKLLFLKILYDISDRDLESRANTDMSFKFFLNLEPEDNIPHASLLAKFRNQRISEDMLEEFLNQTIKQALEKKLIKSNAIIVDSTHTQSKHSPQRPTQILREMSKELRKEIYKTQHEISEKFPEKPSINDTVEEEIEYTKQLVSAIESVGEIKSATAKKYLQRIKDTLDLPNLAELQNGYEHTAKIGHKSKTDEFFGYKNHIAITEDEQFITALEITDGNAADTKSFEALVGKSIGNGIEVSEVIGDTAYSGVKNLKYAQSLEISVISKLNPRVGSIEKSDNYVFFNKDANTYECKNGCLATTKKCGYHKKNGSQKIEFSFRATDCKKCPYFKKCVGQKANPYRRICDTITLPIYDKQKNFQETEYFKKRYQRRGLIEGKNAELKQNYGLKRTYGTGLFSMKVQAFLTAFTANARKITRLATGE
jgi:transposase